jgi:hypothetical protein
VKEVGEVEGINLFKRRRDRRVKERRIQDPRKNFVFAG